MPAKQSNDTITGGQSILHEAIDGVIARAQPTFGELFGPRRMANADASNAVTVSTAGTNQVLTARRAQAGVPNNTTAGSSSAVPAASGPHPASPQGIAEARGQDTSHDLPQSYLSNQQPMPWIDINPFNCRYLGPTATVPILPHAARAGEQFCGRCRYKVIDMARAIRNAHKGGQKHPEPRVRITTWYDNRGVVSGRRVERGDERGARARDRSPVRRSRSPDPHRSDYEHLVRYYHRRDRDDKAGTGQARGAKSAPEQVPKPPSANTMPAWAKRAEASPPVQSAQSALVAKKNPSAFEVATMPQKPVNTASPASHGLAIAQPQLAAPTLTTASSPSVPLTDPKNIIPDNAWAFARKMAGAYFFDQIQRGKHELTAAQEAVSYFRNQHLDPRLQREGEDRVVKAAAYQVACFLLQAKQKAHLAKLDGDGW